MPEVQQVPPEEQTNSHTTQSANGLSVSSRRRGEAQPILRQGSFYDAWYFSKAASFTVMPRPGDFVSSRNPPLPASKCGETISRRIARSSSAADSGRFWIKKFGTLAAM